MPQTGVVVTDLNHGVTPTDLVNALLGTGVTVSNVTFTGESRAAGTFSGGITSIGFDSGIVLGSGKVQTDPSDPACSRGVEGPNNCYELSGLDGSDNSADFGRPGDADLTVLSGFTTFDAAVLEFDFVPDLSTVEFQYVFSTEEYSDFANTVFNDVFAFFVNGVNCALVPGTTDPVSVNTINNGNDVGGDPTPHHPELLRDNIRPTVTIDTQMDGLTVILTCTANVNPGVPNHMKLAIADASDGILDAAVFIRAQSLISGTPTPTPSPSPSPTSTATATAAPTATATATAIATATATATPTPTSTPGGCQFSTSIVSNFNGTAINAGRYIWFNSVLKPSGLGATPTTIHFTNQTITSAYFTLPVPDATVTFDPSASSASTAFVAGTWVTTAPSSGLPGNTFFSGLSYQVPANLPGGINPVTWSGTISSDTPGVSVNWKRAAAVYTSLSSDYNALGVKPVDDKNASIYKNSDHAGTPENFKSFVIGGARGGGGANYTGGYSGTRSVGPCPP